MSDFEEEFPAAQKLTGISQTSILALKSELLRKELTKGEKSSPTSKISKLKLNGAFVSKVIDGSIEGEERKKLELSWIALNRKSGIYGAKAKRALASFTK